MSNYSEDNKECSSCNCKKQNKNLEIDNELLNESVNENELSTYIIVLKTRKWLFFREEIICNDYSPYWIVHAVTGVTELNIRTFNLVTDELNIIPYNNILKIVHESGANEQLNILNENIASETKYIEDKKEQIKEIIKEKQNNKDIDVA